MAYTLKFSLLNCILHKDLEGMESKVRPIVVNSDGKHLIIDGRKFAVMRDYEYTYKIHPYGFYSCHSADEWIHELQKDMDDPERFWSETYYTMLLDILEKCPEVKQ